MPRLKCSFSSPTSCVSVGELSQILLPGSQGELGVLPHHAPGLFSLKSGLVKLVKNEDLYQAYYVDGKLAIVGSNLCHILCDHFSLLEDLDIQVLEGQITRYHDDLMGLSIEEEKRILEAKIRKTEKLIEAWRKAENAGRA